MQGCHSDAVSSMQVLHGRISASPDNLNHGRVVFVEYALACSGKESLPQTHGRKQSLVVNVLSAHQLRLWRRGRHTIVALRTAVQGKVRVFALDAQMNTGC